MRVAVYVELDCGRKYCGNCRFGAVYDYCQIFDHIAVEPLRVYHKETDDYERVPECIEAAREARGA